MKTRAVPCVDVIDSPRKNGTCETISVWMKIPSWMPRWNIAPTQLVPIVRQKGTSSRRSFGLVRWGLVPSCAKDRSIATKTINAMSETAADKSAFRDALRLRRCLIPASSFHEWQPNGSKQKQPFSVGMADDSTFAFAGLWETWTDPRGDVVEPCTILTTTPNALVAKVHNRMPVILRLEDYARWLDPSSNNASLLGACLKPFVDPDGYNWMVGTHKAEPSAKETKKGMEKMMKQQPPATAAAD